MRHGKGARIMRHASVVLLVCAVLAGAGRGAAAQGVRYEPRGAGFSATFPAEPQTRSDTQEFGTLIMKAYGYGVDHEGMAYFVSWFGEMPPAATRDPRMEEILYTRLEQVYTKMGTVIGRGEASVAGHSTISLGGVAGRQYVFNSPAAMGVVRGFKVGPRFYIVGVFGNKDGFAAARAVAFLDSFKLKK